MDETCKYFTGIDLHKALGGHSKSGQLSGLGIGITAFGPLAR